MAARRVASAALRPPTVPGVGHLRRRHSVVVAWWLLRAHFYGAGRGSPTDVVAVILLVPLFAFVVAGVVVLQPALRSLYGPVVAIGVVVGVPVLTAALLLAALAGQLLVMLCRPGVRWYGGLAERAVLSIRTRSTRGRTTWEIGNHLSARPGHGLGGELRAGIGAPLLVAADAGAITITCTTPSRNLAAAYMRELPGLEVVGRGWLRGYRLRRVPHPPLQAGVP